MRYRRLTTVLIATLALFTVSCRSSKTVMRQASTVTATDTIRQTVILTIHDTVRETTTVTIQTNTDGDTTKLTTITDREKIINRDRAANQSHATTQTVTQSTAKETTTSPSNPIRSMRPKSQIKILLISILTAFLLGLLLIPLIKLIRRLKKMITY